MFFLQSTKSIAIIVDIKIRGKIMFKNYIFDLYGTLIDIYTCETAPELWEKMSFFYGYRKANYTPSELQQKYLALCSIKKWETMAKHTDYTRVDFDITEIFKDLYTEKGVECSDELAKITANVFRCFSTRHIGLYDGVLDLLDTLKAKDKKIYLLSNAQTDFTRPEMDMLGLTDYFDGILISSEEECSKPDLHYFQMLFDRYGLEKDESVFVGNDCVSDIKGATDFGLKSLYIHQEISPPVSGKLSATWRIMDGDFRQVKKKIVAGT